MELLPACESGPLLDGHDDGCHEREGRKPPLTRQWRAAALTLLTAAAVVALCFVLAPEPTPAAVHLVAEPPRGPPTRAQSLRAWDLGGIAQGVKAAWNNVKQKVGEAKDKALPAVEGEWQHVEGAYGELKKFTTPVRPGGHSEAFIDHAFWGMLGWLLLSGLGGSLLERLFPHFFADPGRPPAWLLCLTAGSYALLIPGVGCVLFSFVVGMDLHLLGIHVTATLDPSTHEPAPITESMLSAVRALQDSGNFLGAAMLAFYGLVIPVVKLFLLVTGELLRCHRAGVARLCIKLVQLSSKWACPDVFAYLLVLYLLRALPDRNSYLEAPSHLDVGFTCFGVFCLASTVSSLGIPLPRDETAEAPAAMVRVDMTDEELEYAGPGQAAEGSRAASAVANGPSSSGAGRNGSAPSAREASAPRSDSLVLGEELPVLEPLLWRTLGPVGLYWVIVALAVTFLGLMYLGGTQASMGLRVHVDWLVQPRGPLPKVAGPFLEALHLSSVNTEVSIWRLLEKLWQWAGTGELNSILGLAMMAGFAILCPLLNVVLIVVAADCLRGLNVVTARWVMKASHAALHLCMLGPCAMGVVVTSLGGSAYRSQGVELLMRPGILFLLAAELLHYTMFYMVESVTEQLHDAR